MNPDDSDPRHLSDGDARDTELRRLCGARERRDEGAAPGYESLLLRPARSVRPVRAAGARGRLSPARFAAAGALFVLLALVTVWAVRHEAALSPTLSSSGQPSLETWQAPTDFLLAVPGGELLDSKPALPDPHLPALPSGS